MRSNACVHRLDLDLYSHPKEFGGGGNGVRIHVNSKGKISSTGKIFSSEENQFHDAASSRTANPTQYQRAIRPHPPPPPPPPPPRCYYSPLPPEARTQKPSPPPGAGIMEADDRQVTVFTVQPSFHHRHSTNRVS